MLKPRSIITLAVACALFQLLFVGASQIMAQGTGDEGFIQVQEPMGAGDFSSPPPGSEGFEIPAMPGNPQYLPQPAGGTANPIGVVPTLANFPVPPVAVSSAQQGVLDDTTMIDLLELKDMDVSDVLKLLSQKTGLNIVAGAEVKGKITIFLKNVKLKDVLRIVLDSNKLAYQYEDGIIRVMSAQEFELRYGYKFGGNVATRILRLTYADSQDVVTLLNQMKSPSGKIISDPKSGMIVLLDTQDKVDFMEKLVKEVDVAIASEVFELTYAQVKDVAEKINEVMTKNVGSLKYDERSKRIFVKDTPTKLADIRKIVEAFDVKRREVLIEAKIVQVDLTNDFKLGVNWKAISEKYHQLTFISQFPSLADEPDWGKLSIGDYADDNYTALIDALETVGKTKILSNPRISALDNEEAKIMVGTSQPYATSTTTTSGSGVGTTAVSINFIDVGVKLSVTPTIHKDNFITMKIRPEISSAADMYEAKSGDGTSNDIPIKKSSEAETTVMVRDGHTIVIGGLINEEKTNDVSKVPLLGDIPWVGMAFRNKTETTRRTEIVIFLTPHIITGEALVPEDNARDNRIDSILLSTKKEAEKDSLSGMNN